MAETEKTYNQGLVDGVNLFVKACSGKGNCDGCPIGSLAGAGVNCMEFIKQFPAKSVGILREMVGEQNTYYNEFVSRMPNCGAGEKVVSTGLCRKAIFEGDFSCTEEDMDVCEKCWNERYEG